MKKVAFVPIKFNSQRLKDKNFLPLGGKPLCWHIFNTLLKVDLLDEVYVFCSNPEIKDFIPDEVTFLQRPTTLDTDQTLGMDIYKAFAGAVAADVYALCHATSPFIMPTSVALGLEKIIYEGYDSAFSVEKHQTFAWYQGQPLNYQLSHIPRTQDLAPVFLENSAFFIFRREVLTDMQRRIGEKPYMVVTNRYEALDIDYQEDYDMATVIYDFINHHKR